MLTIEEMRKALLAKNNYTPRNGGSNSKFFSFTNLKPGDKVRIRLLEDADTDNQYFWRNRANRTLRFNGLMSGGQFYDGEIKVDVPAFNLKQGAVDNTLPAEYTITSAEDPIQQKIKDLWNQGSEGQELYRKFKRREAFLYRGFIRQENGESKFSYFSFSPKMQPMIEKAITDEEEYTTFPEYPIDHDKGRDFIIRVTDNAGRKSYETSSYALSTSALTQQELELLNDEENNRKLCEFMPKKPTVEQVECMEEMYEAVSNDQPFDYDKWSPYFKPSNAYKDSNGVIQVRSGGDYSNSGSDDDTPSATQTEVAQPTSTITPPTQISAEQVNQAISQNTVEVNSGNVDNMVANLLAQFQSK